MICQDWMVVQFPWTHSTFMHCFVKFKIIRRTSDPPKHAFRMDDMMMNCTWSDFHLTKKLMFLEVLEMLQLCVARSIRWKVNTTFSNVLEIETLNKGMVIRNAKIVFSKIIWPDLGSSSGRKTGQANPEIYSENMCRSFSWGHSLFVLFLRPYSVFNFTGWNIIPKCYWVKRVG